MSTLLLVRHGKASAFSDGEYDQLSPAGERQLRLLAGHWAEAKGGARVTPDAVFVGPRKRQAQSHDIVRDAYVGRGLGRPEPVVLEGLDEHDGFGVVIGAMPEIAKSDEHVARMLQKMAAGVKPTNEEALEAF